MKPLHRLAAGLLLTTLAVGTLAGTAAADDTTSTPGTTVTVPGTDDTWWGLQPTTPTPDPTGTTARPSDTWWG